MRKDIDRKADLLAFSEVFRESNILKRVDPFQQETSMVISFDGTIEWTSGVSIKRLHDQGYAFAQRNQEKAFQLVVPLSERLYQDEVEIQQGIDNFTNQKIEEAQEEMEEEHKESDGDDGDNDEDSCDE
mgnify:CR=1 FL=1